MQCVYNRMATMSKLKRKKSAIEESRCEQQSRIKKSNDSPSEVQDSSCRATSTGGARWWESSELSDAERLWALTLRAFCPALQSDQEECIPQLPPPSSMRTPVQKLSDWRWGNADEDVHPPPDLPAPSFLTTPTQVNGFSAPSQPPAAENTGESVPPANADQENHASSPDQESVSICDIQTAQPHHLEDKVNCIELSDEQSDKFDQVGKVLETQSGGSGAGKGAKTGAGGSGSWLRMISEAEGKVSGMGTKQGAGLSGSGQKAKSGAGQRAKSGVKQSGLALGVKSRAELDVESGPGKGVKIGAGGSGSRLRTISEAVSSMGTKQGLGGSGSGQRAKSGLGGFESVLVTNSGASGSGLRHGTTSGSDLGTTSGAGLYAESGPGKGVKTSAGGSGSRLRTISEAVSSMGTKQGAGGSGSGKRAKSGLGGFGGNSGASGSRLGQGTKAGLDLGTKSEGSGAASGSGLGAKSEAEGSGATSGSGLGAKSEAEGSGATSGSGLGAKSEAEGSGAGSGLECCPMCLMLFPAGFTQMECDGHLAQCLSEMQGDIIW